MLRPSPLQLSAARCWAHLGESPSRVANLASPGNQRQQRFAGAVVKDRFVEHAVAVNRGYPRQHRVRRLLP